MTEPTPDLTIQWGDPPITPPKQTKWQKILQQFVDNPGKTGQVPGDYTENSANALVYNINSGNGKTKLPDGTNPGDFHATRAPTKNERWGIWVTYTKPTKQGGKK